MHGKLLGVAVAAGLGCVSGSACAMSGGEQKQHACRVIGGEKLPAKSGGADALCGAIAAAVAEQAPGQSYSIEIRVLPQSRLSASIRTGDGRPLPQQGFASMDKPLTSGSFKRFAASIAAQLAKANATKS